MLWASRCGGRCASTASLLGSRKGSCCTAKALPTLLQGRTCVPSNVQANSRILQKLGGRQLRRYYEPAATQTLST